MSKYLGYDEMSEEQRRKIIRDVLISADREDKVHPHVWNSVCAVVGPERYVVEHRCPKKGEYYFSLGQWVEAREGHSPSYERSQLVRVRKLN